MGVTVLSLRHGAPLYRQWLRCVPDRSAPVRLERHATLLPGPWPVVALCQATLDAVPHVLVQGLLGQPLWLPAAALKRDEFGELWTDVIEGLGSRVELTWQCMQSREVAAPTSWVQVFGDESWVYVRLWDEARCSAEGPVLRASCADVLHKFVVADAVLSQVESAQEPLRFEAVAEHASAYWITRFLSGFELMPFESQPSSERTARSAVDPEQASVEDGDSNDRTVQPSRTPDAAEPRPFIRERSAGSTESQVPSGSPAAFRASLVRDCSPQRLAENVRVAEGPALPEPIALSPPRAASMPMTTHAARAAVQGEHASAIEESAPHPLGSVVPDRERESEARLVEAEVRLPTVVDVPEQALLSADEPLSKLPRRQIKAREVAHGQVADELSRAEDADAESLAGADGTERAQASNVGPVSALRAAPSPNSPADAFDRSGRAASDPVRSDEPSRRGVSPERGERTTTFRPLAAVTAPMGRLAWRPSRGLGSRGAATSVSKPAAAFAKVDAQRPTERRMGETQAFERAQVSLPRAAQRSLPVAKEVLAASPSASAARPTPVDPAGTSQSSGVKRAESSADVQAHRATTPARDAQASVAPEQSSGLLGRSAASQQERRSVSDHAVASPQTDHAAPASPVTRPEIGGERHVPEARAPLSLARWLTVVESDGRGARAQGAQQGKGADRELLPRSAADSSIARAASYPEKRCERPFSGPRDVAPLRSRLVAAPQVAVARATQVPSYQPHPLSRVARPRIARTIEIGEVLVDLSWEPRAAPAPDSTYVTAGALVDSIPWSRSLGGGYR